uniref:Uncharacterized protein n=1 Tax=Ciona savignyi TaxID=51511 RepID=H2ZLP9_CIOSA
MWSYSSSMDQDIPTQKSILPPTDYYYLGPLMMLVSTVSFLALCYLSLKICNYYMKRYEASKSESWTDDFFCCPAFCRDENPEGGQLLERRQLFYASTVSLGRSASPESAHSQLTFTTRTRDRIRFLSFSEETRKSARNKLRFQSLPTSELLPEHISSDSETSASTQETN